MRMPPLPTDSIHARACKLKCEKILTRPIKMFPLFSLWRGNFDWSKGDYAQEMFLELCKLALKYT